MKGMLYEKEIKINNDITLRIPTIREIIEDDERFYQWSSIFTSTPYDMMVQLDDMGIDFSTISEYELFCGLFEQIKNEDLKILFGDLDLTKFQISINTENNETVFYDEEHDIVIDKGVYYVISNEIRNLLGLKKVNKKPANEEARKFMIERARKKQSRSLSRQKQKNTTQLEDLIISLVNTSEFSYTYETVLDLTIFQFNQSLTQISKKVRFDKLMIGCYAGTLDTSKINKDELSWLK